MVARGIRNNNPLNIRHGQKWKGLAPVQTDKSFDQFISMEYGIRAAFKLIKKYIGTYKCNTIRKIIHRWAPPVENNTSSYVNFVSSKVGVDPDEVVSFTDKDTMVKLISAMIQQENGSTVDMNIINKAYSMV